MIGLVNTVAACLSVFTLSLFGRRTLLLFGHTVICITYILLAIFTITGNDIGVLSMICVFLLVYENTSGPVAWTYAAETCCDVSLGVGILSLYATVFVLSLSSEPLM